jgi:hypothetical protein
MNELKYAIKDNKLVNIETGVFIPEEEPVFILRAKDLNSLAMLEYYKFKIKEGSVLHGLVSKRIEDFTNFKTLYPELMKVPD